ncbi:zinc finger and SCAN domain-containing protein 31-like isoform X2 [Anolis sagrei]|uniref:zinc finger and SCAN domain-containing protein 31-like isoform X2 n=1 Tax=Anolis sagrei TaxID=38937 RepID=UPI0035200D5B
MEELNTANLEQGTPRKRGTARSRDQSEYVTEEPMWKAPKEGNELPGERMQQLWEAQWQEFLKTLQSPSSPWGSLPPAQEMPWEDAKAFLASFEQVAKACRWPKEEWVAGLLPALSGEAEQAFQSLEAGDRNDYGKVKAAILRTEALGVELHRQHFRQFCCQEVEDPRRVYSQVQELCSRWLKPERRSKEQILELLVLEQFLASLPLDLQGWVRGAGPETCSQAVALAEDFLLRRQQEADSAKWQGLLDHKDIGTSLQSVEQSLSQPGQQTIFWQVLQEEGRSTQAFGEVKATSLKVEVSQHGGDELEERPGAVKLVYQGDGLLTTEMCGQRSGGKSSCIKMEDPPPEGPLPMETLKGWEEVSPWSLQVTNEIHKPRWDSKEQKKKKLPLEGENKCSKFAEGRLPEVNKNCAMQTAGGKSLSSRYSRRHHYNARLVAMHNKGNLFLCPTLGETIQQKSNLEKHQGSAVGKKQPQLSESRKSFHPGVDSVQSQALCGPSTSGKSRLNIKALSQDQGFQTKAKPYQCSQCGKSYRHRKALTQHQKIHTGKKHHRCSICGKGFYYKDPLLRHQRVHTGDKPYQCSQCGKWFRQKAHLMSHQTVHTGEKPFKCPKCGKDFSRRDKLIRHQSVHRTQRPVAHPGGGTI